MRSHSTTPCVNLSNMAGTVRLFAGDLNDVSDLKSATHQPQHSTPQDSGRSTEFRNLFVEPSLRLEMPSSLSSVVPSPMVEQGTLRSEVGSSENDSVLSMEDLAHKFNVSTKTISRWREHGLVAGRFMDGGRARVGFLTSAVDQFIVTNRLRVDRGSKFSQLTTLERERVIAWARRLAQSGACPAETHRQIAKRLNRSAETIRYTVKDHDQKHPEAAVFPDVDGKLRPETRQRIYLHFLRNESVDEIAKKFRRSRASIYRIILTQRAEHLLEFPLEYIPSPLFSRRNAEKVVGEPMPGLGDAVKKIRRPTGLPAYLASLYEVPLLTREQEVWLFRKFNYLKYKASKLRETLDPERPSRRLMDQIDAIVAEVVSLKNTLVRANLRLVVSIAKKRVSPGDGFFDLVSDGNMSLIRAVEKFDYSRGFKFSTYGSWAIMKNYSRSIPDEHRRRDRFRAADIDALQTATDTRPDQNQLRLAENDRAQQVGKFLNKLDSREQTIIVRRYGLDHVHEPQTLKEVGTALGVTKERVRQIEARALEKLRNAAVAEHVFPELEE
ncbi:MAG: sigma-70 family RNA polymerase sigma factor [Planctomycetia bacterium]|nr:sigma-70 family RNA polymerase sigma factor [Planctomycetia bacterium]